MKKKPIATENSSPSENKVYRSILDDKQSISKVSDIDMSGTYSYADYFSWKFEGRFELINGKVFKMSPVPSTAHQRLCGYLFIRLFATMSCSGCELFISPFDVRLPKESSADKDIYTLVKPDICIVCDEDKIDSRGCLGAPDLIVEILSAGNNKRELIDKFDLYEEAGVKEYWVMNPAKKYFYIYYLNVDGKYRSTGVNFYNRAVESTVFPEFNFNLSELAELE